MAERSIIDQLDDAVAAITEQRTLDLTNIDSEVSSLADVARSLVGLPREAFKARLKEQLIRSDSMSSPAQQIEATPVQSVSIHLVTHNTSAAIDFYREAFGAKELFRLNEAGGKVGHAQ